MNYKYYVAVISAFTIWGFFSLVLKSLDAYPAFDILSYRSVLSVFIMLVVSLVLRPKILKKNIQLYKSLSVRNKQKFWIMNALSGLFLALNWFIFIYVMNAVSVSATSLAYLICPILTMVLAYLILKEKLFNIQWFSVVLSLLSCLLLSLGNFMDLLYSMIIALTYAIYLVIQRKNQDLDRFLTLTVQVGFAVILLLPFFPSQVSDMEKTTLFYGMLLLISVVFTIIPMFLNFYALKGLNSSVVGVFIYLNPIINFMLAIFYFKEKITLLQGISYGLIGISVIIFNIPNFRSHMKKRKAIHVKI